MGLTRAARVEAIRGFRFTEREARFIELVLRHGGVCVPRQFAAFAAVPNGGDKCNAFFAVKLLQRGRATCSDCVHNRARIYHVHYRRLYQAIGEPNSRYHRAVPARQAIERLMHLDAVLTTPGVEWFTSVDEKVSLIARSGRTVLAPTDADATTATPLAPAVPTGGSRDMFPFGVDATGRVVLLYLVREPWTDSFRSWLQAHAPVLQAVSAWTLQLVFPRPLDRAYSNYQQVIHDELETLLQSAIIDPLRASFERRPPSGPSRGVGRGLFTDTPLDIFDTPRFRTLYRRWRKAGERVFEPLVSTVLADDLMSGSGRVETQVLPYAYRHLIPVEPPRDPVLEPVEKGAEIGDETHARA
jgi:hypothetical protein